MKYYTEKRLYLDIDGTLSVFHPVDNFEELLEPGFFLRMEPNMNIINAVKNLFEGSFFDDIYILSAVLRENPLAKIEKTRWLQQYLPEIDEDHMLFPFCDESKASAVDKEGKIPSSYYLLDDYNRNLYDWIQCGGTGIKFLNGINHVRKTWKGATVSNTEKCFEELFIATA